MNKNEINTTDVLNALLAKRQEISAKYEKHNELAKKDKREMDQIDAQIFAICPNGLTDVDKGVISIILKPHIRTAWQKVCGILKDNVSKKLYDKTFNDYTTRTVEREMSISYKETL